MVVDLTLQRRGQWGAARESQDPLRHRIDRALPFNRAESACGTILTRFPFDPDEAKWMPSHPRSCPRCRRRSA